MYVQKLNVDVVVNTVLMIIMVVLNAGREEWK